MLEYAAYFLSDEDGAEGIAAICIIACVAVLVSALYALSGRLEERNAGAKDDAIISGRRKGYGNVTIK